MAYISHIKSMYNTWNESSPDDGYGIVHYVIVVQLNPTQSVATTVTATMSNGATYNVTIPANSNQYTPIGFEFTNFTSNSIPDVVRISAPNFLWTGAQAFVNTGGGYGYTFNNQIPAPKTEYLNPSYSIGIAYKGNNTNGIKLRSSGKLLPQNTNITTGMSAFEILWPECPISNQRCFKYNNIWFCNFLTTDLKNELLSAQTVLHLQDRMGRQFPDIKNGESMMLCLIDRNKRDLTTGQVHWELVKVTEKFRGPANLVGEKDDLRIVRAQEGTTAHYFPATMIR